MHADHWLAYRNDPDLGNCGLCGNFANLKAARIAGKSNQLNGFSLGVSESIREDDQQFRPEVPMDIILVKLMEDAEALNPEFRADAFYLSNREVFVEWMFDLAEKLRVQPETFHHSVNIFDAYLLRPDI